ncbi:MAG: hypothetical protein ACREOI_27345 [bacterium]
MQKQCLLMKICLTLLALALVTLWGGAPLARAQQPPGSNMQQRLEQVIAILQTAEACQVVEAAIDDGMEILYGGLRPLPSKGPLLDVTKRAHEAISEAELKFAKALKTYVEQGKCLEQRGRALDLALFIEEMNEVASAVGNVTDKVGDGDRTDQPPGDELLPLLNEDTGETALKPRPIIIRSSFSVKLRSPAVPSWIRLPQEDVRVTAPIPPNHCVVVFKETKGLMLRLHFERIIVVTDPWVTVFGNLPRGTRVPIWRLEWVPAEYVKEWNICNIGGTIRKTVTQRVKQETPLNFFWRFYKKDP